VAERARDLALALGELAPQVPGRFLSDLQCAVTLAHAAIEAALATASANIAAMDEDGTSAELIGRMEKLE
jgi:formiminotetrahydrofolate cyclodeaminase